MMQNLNVGLMMTIIGMGVVLFFLVSMMFVMRVTEAVMAKLGKWFPEEVPAAPVAKKQSQASGGAEVAVAIASAMRKLGIKGGNNNGNITSICC